MQNMPSPTPAVEPRFIIKPEDQFIVNNKPAYLVCAVEKASDVRFKCNGLWLGKETIHSVDEERDPETGIKTTRVVLRVNRYVVDTFFSPQNYWCRCVAWNASGRIQSKRAVIKVAYLRHNFELQPVGGRHLVGEQIKLSCAPPNGVPLPSVYWMKNEAKLLPTPSANYVTTDEGRSLIIRAMSVEDSGNYTCVAKNMASKRKSMPAPIQVAVNGNWNKWSSWSTCNVKCGLGQAKRSRNCNNPSPANGGAPCKGKKEQTKSCTTICPVDGGWTDWSSWSTCSPACLHRRRRTCTKPLPRHSGRPCPGEDLQTKQCSWIECTNNRTSKIGPNTLMYDTLFAAVVFFFLSIITVLFLLHYKKKRETIKQQSPTKGSSSSSTIGKYSQFYPSTPCPHYLPTYFQNHCICENFISNKEDFVKSPCSDSVAKFLVHHYPDANSEKLREVRNEIGSTQDGDEESNRKVVYSWTQLSQHQSNVVFPERWKCSTV